MLLEEQLCANLLDGLLELETYHKTLSAHLFYCGNFLKLGHQVVTHFVYILQQVLVLNNVEHRLCCCAGKVVAAECCTQLSEDGGELGADEHRSHREAVGDALCHGDEVGADTCPLVSKEFSAAAVSALNLVEHKDGACCGTLLLQLLQEFGLGNNNAADTLDTLDDNCSNVAFGKLGAYGLNVVQGQVCCVVVVVDGCNDFGIVGYLDSQRCASVE